METTPAEYKPPSLQDAFLADTTVQQYGPNSLAIFALPYYLRLQDPEEFAANSITEGKNDKKVDIFHIDLNERYAIIAQCYLSTEWGRAAAPAGKAADLNTATTWLLSADPSNIPPALRARALDLRQAILEGDIDRIELLYIHNCHESNNVREELAVAARGTRDLVTALTGETSPPVTVAYRELGLESIEDLYSSADKEILIEGWLDVPTAPLIEERGESWHAVLTSVPGEWLKGLHTAHGNRLFSANYRDYLGSSQRKGNINYQITQTADAEPGNFWVFNNGVTALTHELTLSPRLRIRGLSIINGAQTTGALGGAAPETSASIRVPFRVVECSDRALIDKIIRYNNTQNEIRPSDRRSNDPTQQRVRAELATLGITYVHRRSGPRLPRNAITAESIAPALCAFHGDPQTAFRNAKDIFDDDTTYERTFPRFITIHHIFLIRSLSLAIDSAKVHLQAKREDGTATTVEEGQAEVLRYSASKHFVFYLMGSAAEEIMGRKVPDLSTWQAIPTVVTPDNHSLHEAWQSALHAVLPNVAALIVQRGPAAFYEVPRSRETSKQVVDQLKALLASLESVLAPQFEPLRLRSTT